MDFSKCVFKRLAVSLNLGDGVGGAQQQLLLGVLGGVGKLPGERLKGGILEQDGLALLGTE